MASRNVNEVMRAAVRKFEATRPIPLPEGDALFRDIATRTYTMAIDLLQGAKEAIGRRRDADAAILAAEACNCLESLGSD
jgi:hypothetical protein